jgi:hypothetical protein
MNTTNVLAFIRPTPKPSPKGYVSLSQAERQRCAEIFQSPEAQGSWATAARILTLETDLPAQYVVASLKQMREQTRIEIAAGLSAAIF